MARRGAKAIKESAAGVVVIEPRPAELGSLLGLLDQHPVPVVVDSRWTNPYCLLLQKPSRQL